MLTNPTARLRQENTRRKLCARLLPAANLILWECPVAKSVTVSSINICNTGTVQTNFRLFHLIASESASVTTALMYDMLLQANETTLYELQAYMNPGDRLVAYASTASAVAVSVFGSEQ